MAVDGYGVEETPTATATNAESNNRASVMNIFDFLQWIFSDFWRWLGLLFILAMLLNVNIRWSSETKGKK